MVLNSNENQKCRTLKKQCVVASPVDVATVAAAGCTMALRNSRSMSSVRTESMSLMFVPLMALRTCRFLLRLPGLVAAVDASKGFVGFGAAASLAADDTADLACWFGELYVVVAGAGARL